MDYKFILYIIFGILPSLFWLFYYLRKDLHPEPKKMILKIFLWGALATIPVFFIQLGLREILNITSLNLGLPNLDYLLELSLSNLNYLSFIVVLVYWFLIISFTEELFKFLVVRMKVQNSPNLDEPTDIVIYMIVAALGFAAVENILYLFVPEAGVSFNTIVNRTLIITLIRSLGATFLHTLCSALIGYALAMAYCKQKNSLFKISFGIIAATLLHGLYDFSIIVLEGYLKLAIPAAIIIFLAVFVISGFNKLSKIKSVTIINNK